MGAESIKGLNLSSFSRIYFVVKKSHVDQYQFISSFHKTYDEFISSKITFVILEESTNSQPETVYRCIVDQDIVGPILIKDSDNYFEVSENIAGENCVYYFDLNDGDAFNIRDKSFIQLDASGYINNIVEKKVISSTFSVGGYGFESAAEFCSYFERISSVTSELYMSNVIFEMLLDGHNFIGIKSSNYEDWGTIEEWNKYKRTFKTLFIDLDGVLIENTSPYTAPFTGTGAPIRENIGAIRSLYETGRTKIIITTSRSESTRSETELELAEHGIPWDILIMDLPHSQRIVINDFAASNPFPSCDAINLQRNSNNLKDQLT